jgi:hypothetical protein
VTVTDSAAKRRIVVGVDGSQPSRHALQWAGFMARSLDAEVCAVAVWDISPVMADAWVDDWNPEEETATQLRAIVTEILGSRPPVPVHEIVRRGSAAGELIQASRDAQDAHSRQPRPRRLPWPPAGVRQLNQRGPRALSRPDHPRRHPSPAEFLTTRRQARYSPTPS